MHKSIFLKVTDYLSDPITEYRRICKFINKYCYFSNSIHQIMEKNFQKCECLRTRFIDFEECLVSCTENINSDFTRYYEYYQLEEEKRLKILDDFLSFCEVVYCLLKTVQKEYMSRSSSIDRKYFDYYLFEQTFELIDSSLKSLNYKLEIIDENKNTVVAIKINPEVEVVAAQSEPSIRHTILAYLGCKDIELEEKERIRLQLINQLEPTMIKYQNDNTISKMKGYVQLIRHPERKNKELRYKWFFENKNQYLDDLFLCCIYVQQHLVVKQKLKDFDNFTIE